MEAFIVIAITAVVGLLGYGVRHNVISKKAVTTYYDTLQEILDGVGQGLAAESQATEGDVDDDDELEDVIPF